MPHVDIKYFPRNLSDEKLKTISDEICDVLKKHLGASEDSLSVAMTEIAPDRWKLDVYDPLIKPGLLKLVKKPGYNC